MNSENNYISTPNPLVKYLAEEFFRGINLIREIPDDIYQQKANGTGSIGGHFRHNLDFVNSFLNGLEVGKIDYQKRERDEKIEQNRQYAIERIIFSTRRLLALKSCDLEKNIAICSELEPNIYHNSNVMRELEFLHSHTVHHHALIAEKLASFGVKVSDGFGVAPSTLKFWAEQKEIAQEAA
jgi:hypothetical protein